MPTETVEHAPPRAYFQDKYRLKGLEFPACKRCNEGSAKLDQVASWFALTMSGIFSDLEDDGYWRKLSEGVANNSPDALSYLGVDNAKAAYWSVEGSLTEKYYRAKIDRRLFTEFLNPWAAKQGFALWYHHCSRPLGCGAKVWTRWQTNEQLLKGGLPREVVDLCPKLNFLRQGVLESSDQFMYRYATNLDEGLALFVLAGHLSSSIVIVISESGKATQGLFSTKGEVFSTSPETGIFSVNDKF